MAVRVPRDDQDAARRLGGAWGAVGATPRRADALMVVVSLAQRR